MKLREFKETDADKIASLSNENGEFFQYPKVTADFLKSMALAQGYKMFVLSEGSNVIGFCGLNYQSMPLVEIGPICVEEGRRMHGLGRLLIDEVFEFLQPLNPPKVIIKVKASNIAGLEFFESLGFQKVAETVCKNETAILMEHGLERF